MEINSEMTTLRPKLKILLVIPKTSHTWGTWPVPPIGTAYVSSSLKAAGYSVATINLNMEEETPFSILKRIIDEEEIEVVGCGGLVLNHAVVKEIIQLAKQIKPKIFTFIGGSLVTNSPQEAMEIIKDADVGMIGEGEITAVQLMDALLTNTNLMDVPGLILRTNDGYLQTLPQKELVDIDQAPWPDYDGFRFHEFTEKILQVYGNKSIAVTASRSCPFHCTFCSKSGGDKYRQRSLDSLFKEIEHLIHEHHYTQFFFNDELFAFNLDRIIDFCNRIEPFQVEWLVFLRVNKYLTIDILNRMKQCGCIQIFYGIESADDQILKSMKKGITLAEIEETLQNTVKAEILSSGSIIIGDTEETHKTVENSIKWVKEKSVTAWLDILVTPIKLYPGSELYKRAVTDGLITNTVSFIEQDCPLVNVSKISNLEYKHLVDIVIPEITLMLHNRRNSFDFGTASLKRSRHSNSYTFYYECVQCGENNSAEIMPGQIIQRLRHKCGKCGKVHAGYIHNIYFKKIEPILFEFFKKQKIAIWGCGFSFEAAYSVSDALKKASYMVVDSNIAIQGKCVCGHKVDSPVQLANSEIGTIIVMSSSTSDIMGIIKKQYPEIAHSVGIFEMMLDEV